MSRPTQIESIRLKQKWQAIIATAGAASCRMTGRSGPTVSDPGARVTLVMAPQATGAWRRGSTRRRGAPPYSGSVGVRRRRTAPLARPGRGFAPADVKGLIAPRARHGAADLPDGLARAAARTHRVPRAPAAAGVVKTAPVSAGRHGATR